MVPLHILDKACKSLLLLILLIASGCGHSLKLVRNNFYDYDALSAQLDGLQTDFPSITKVESLGRTYEGRSILAVRLSGNPQSLNTKPALMAIFTEHGCEHDVTNIAMGIIKNLSNSYGKDERVTALLDDTEVWIVPMMNPDGAEHDLSGSVSPFSWRKNRRPTGPQTCGVDLNRNWEYDRKAPVPKGQPKELTDRESSFYGGEVSFSEAETRAVRDFLLSHHNVEIFVDYHSGYAGFMQGGIGCYTGRSSTGNIQHPDIDMLCGEVIEKLASAITDSKDGRPGFLVANRADAAEELRERMPFYMKPFAPAKLPESPGTSIQYVYEELGVLAIGVEIFRNHELWRNLPGSLDRLVKNQARGLLLLLDVLDQSARAGRS